MLKIILSLTFLLSLNACHNVGTADYQGTSGTLGGNVTNSNFAGLDSISNKTDTTVTLNWTPHSDAASYEIFDMQSGSSVYITNINGQAASSITLTNLTPSAIYHFNVRMRTSVGDLEGKANAEIPVSMNVAPNAPASLSVTGAVVTATPTIRITGVKDGDTIKMFSDNTCTTQLASGVATGATIDLTSSALGLGTHNFYAKATNAASSSSACSTATVAYSVLSFAGITSVTGKTDSTATINWTAHADAVSYDILDAQSGTPVLITNVSGQASNSATLTGLIPSAAYKFRVRLRTSLGQYDGNTTEIAATMNAAPDVPSALSIVGSVITSTPVVRVGGVKNGNTVKLFTDNTCTTQVASGMATGSTIELTTSTLALGNHNFYATSTNSTPTASACSTATVGYSVLNFAGITSVTAKTDSTITINWSAHAEADSYDILNAQSGPPVLLTNVSGQSSNSVTLTGLTPSTAYKFRVRLKTASGFVDGNTTEISTTLNAAPNVPSALSIISGLTSTPTVRVSGVKNGDDIRIFRDSYCTIQVASGSATGTTIDLTTSALAVGAYNFYATATNSVPTASACSSATVNYVVCPTGYLAVGKNVSLGVSNPFCVSKYEMKNVAGVATSQSASAPWVNIDQITAKANCTSLGTGYEMISNPEWMTIAYEIEARASNWSSGTVGTGMLNRGHSDGNPNTACDGALDNVDNNCATLGVDFEQKRTHTLSGGGVIWDFAGNVWEWANWALSSTLTSGPTSCAASWTQLPDVNCGALSAAQYLPGNPAGVNPAIYGSTFGLGLLYGGPGNGSAIRGGRLANGANAGIFALALDPGPTDTYVDVGFRCVYHP